jgi:hypothetical protein
MKNSKINLTNNVIFASIEASEKMQKTLLGTSEEKAISLQKNVKNRLKVNETFCKCSNDVLSTIASHSSNDALEYLLNAKNYKTAERIRDVAKMLCKDSKYSVSIDQVTMSLKKNTSKEQNIFCTMKSLILDSKNCYSRASNTVKALAFFKLVIVENASVDAKTMIIDKMSQDTRIMLN